MPESTTPFDPAAMALRGRIGGAARPLIRLGRVRHLIEQVEVGRRRCSDVRP